MRPVLSWATGALALAAACTTPPDTVVTAPAPGIEFSTAEVQQILRHSPLAPPPVDTTNAYANDPGAAELGQRLFFDENLSLNGEISCATCHLPDQSWTDGRVLARGVADVHRNTPKLWNVSHNRWFFINQISLRNLFIVNPFSTFDIAGAGWDESRWLREREALDALTSNTLAVARGILCALLALVMTRRRDVVASLAWLAFLPFVLASAIGRGARFLLVAALMRWGGEPMEKAMHEYVDRIGWVVIVVVVAAYIFFKL